MKNTLRFISAILCAVMLLGCITIYAEDTFDKLKADYLTHLINQDEKNSKYTVEDIFIKAEYGNHSGYDIVVMGISGQLTSPAVGSISIAGITFTFGYADNIATFYAYKDGSFIPVSEAYDAGLLNNTDIYNIAVAKGDIVLPKYKEIWTGGNITLTLEETTSTLYVSGEGRTDDYELFWIDGLGGKYVSPVFGNTAIKRVVIEEGITYIGRYFFDGCDNIEAVEFPESLEEIADHAFHGCYGIRMLVFPEGIKRIGNFCFENENLNTVTFYGNIPKMKEYSVLTWLEGAVYYPADNPTWTEEAMAKYSPDIIWKSWNAPKIQKVINKFEDVGKNAWYTDAVQYVYDNEMMVGTAFNLFEPNTAMTRAQVVQVLFNLSGENKEKYMGESRFTDVSATAWYTPAVNWAERNMITDGVGFDRFAPNQLVNRGELVTFLLNFAMELGCTTNPSGANLKEYYDYRQVQSWCYNSMAWAVQEGIISGMTETTLAPKATANRAQAARMLMKYYEYLDRNLPVLSDTEQAIADYVREKGEHSISLGEYEYTVKEDGKYFSIEYAAYGYIKFSYKTSPRGGYSLGGGNYQESISITMNGLAEEYGYYYHNSSITSSGMFTPNGFVENEFENKHEYLTDEEAYAMRDLAKSELVSFMEKTLADLGLTINDLFIEK